MSYKHLILSERNKIEVLNKESYSSRRIANEFKGKVATLHNFKDIVIIQTAVE